MDKCAAGSDTDKLRSDFDSLQRWNALVDAVDKRVDQCRSNIEQLKHYQVQSDFTDSHVKVYLHSSICHQSVFHADCSDCRWFHFATSPILYNCHTLGVC